MPACDDLSAIPGLGPKRIQALQDANIFEPIDLLHILPQPHNSDPKTWQAGEQIQCVGNVAKLTVQFIRRKGAMITVTIQLAHGILKARFFNALYLKKQIQEGQSYLWSGTLDKKRGDTLVMPRFKRLDDNENPSANVYPQAPLGISQTALAKWIHYILDSDYPIHDPIGLLSDADYRGLLSCVHDQQSDPGAWKQAQEALALREMCGFVWQLNQIRKARSSDKAKSLKLNTHQEQAARDCLPFSLSTAQEEAWHALALHLHQKHPVHTLLQGDVGCGKSAVAFLAAVAAMHNGLHVLYLAPTHLLALQQHALFKRYLAKTDFQTQHCTRQNRSTKSQKPCIFVGTHVLLQDDLTFDQIGLIIIDEQQKFGVAQRKTLIHKCAHQNHKPHLCMMSATPIPRSLQLSHFGDLDLISINQRPQQHAAVETKLIKQPRIDRFAPLCKPMLERNERVLCVAPYLESEHQGVLHAQRLHEQLCKDFSDETCVLLHGKLSDEEQAQIIEAITDGPARILVATSIIEVGFNLPQATGMIIVNSERFGLAQLHQMRGRLGRGHLNGVCYFCSPNPGQHPRLEALLEFHDGFAIAEADLQQRGSGDLLGQRQHGLGFGYTGLEQQQLALLAQAQTLIDSWGKAPGRQLFNQSH